MKWESPLKYNFYAEVISNIEGEDIDLKRVLEFTYSKSSENNISFEEYLSGDKGQFW